MGSFSLLTRLTGLLGSQLSSFTAYVHTVDSAASARLTDASSVTIDTRAHLLEWDHALRYVYTIPPCVVRLSEAARSVFEAERAELHRATQAFEKLHPSFAAHLAKRTGMLARLALTFHAITDHISAPVSSDTMQRAVRFLRSQERHAQAVYSELLGVDTGITLAKAIARSILASELQTFNRRELTQRCKAFRGAAEPTRLAALSLLADCGWLVCTDPKQHGATWTVDQLVHTLFSEHGAAAAAFSTHLPDTDCATL